MSTSTNPPPIPEEFKIWYLAESRKPIISKAYEEWKRRGQQLCYEVAYTEGYEDASEAVFRHLSPTGESADQRWTNFCELFPEDYTKVKIRRAGTKKPINLGVISEAEPEWFLTYKGEKLYYDELEWLDEAPSQPSAGMEWLDSMNAHKRLIGELNEYICLLCAELDDVIGGAAVHGWRSARVEKGKELRERIAKCVEEVNAIVLPEITAPTPTKPTEGQ